MADSKITALTSIGASTDPANDPLVLVDVSDTSMAATGTTKKVTLNQLLGASGTATLASATITGDLTVDTSTLKVDSANNNVGIGTASPNNNTNRTTLTLNNASWGGQLDINVGATNHAQFGSDNFSTGASCRIQSLDHIAFKTNNGSVLGAYLNANGAFSLQNAVSNANGVGIVFPATQAASSNANTLDDYEEGTWTPDLKFGGNNTGMTYGLQAARYVKIGRQVTVNCIIVLSAKGSSTGSATISGLPFTSANATSAYYAGIIRVDGVAFSTVPQCFISSNSSSVTLESVATTATPVNMADTSFTNSSVLILTIEYSV